MELPPVSVPPGAPSSLPPVVTATVQSVLGPYRYEIQIQGMLLEIEAHLFLSVGDKLPLRVARQSPNEVVFELVRPPRKPAGEAPDPHRFPPEAREVVREFVRMRAPLDPALVERAAKLAHDAPTAQAAAFLAAHGFEPAAEPVDALARLLLPPPPIDEASPLVAASPREFAGKAELLARSSATPFEAGIAAILERSPRLRVIDRLIEAFSAAAPREAPGENLAEALRLARSATPETLDEALRSLPPLPKEALRELLRQLQEMERREIASVPELAGIRQNPGTALEAAERLGSLRLVNQLAQLRGDGVLVLEVPVLSEGRIDLIPLRIRREAEKKGRAETGPRFAVTVDADLSRVGLVRAHLDSAGKTLRIRLRVRDRGVRDHLERGAGELAEALRAQGFEAAVAAELVQALERESIFDAFAAPDGSITLDVTL